MNKLAVLVLLVGVAACSNKKPEEKHEAPQTPPPGAVVGVPVSPSAGGAAASGTAPASAPAEKRPDAPTSVGCATATALTCEADQVDGCASGLTSVHVCVAKDAKPGPPCAQELALTCPAGQVDACMHNPPQAPTHLCVIAPKAP